MGMQLGPRGALSVGLWLVAQGVLAQTPERETAAREQAQAGVAADTDEAAKEAPDAQQATVVLLAEERAEATDSVASEELAERAALIESLLRGHLAPEVDADALLRWSLLEGPVRFELWEQARLPRAKRTLPSDPGAAALVSALARYLSLPEARQRRILSQHRVRHREYLAEQEAERTQREQLEQLTSENARIARWLGGELDSDQSVDGLLQVDLVPPELPDGRDEAEKQLREDLEAAYARRRELVESVASLSEKERSALREVYAERRRELAEEQERRKRERSAQETAQAAQANAARTEAQKRASEVSKQRKDALKSAAQARSEAQRLFSTERARLLGVQEDLARFEAELTDVATQMDAPRERALAFQRRVQAIAQRSPLEGGKERQADRLYLELRDALTQGRKQLGEALSVWRDPDSSLTPPVGGADTSLLDDADREHLARLRGELEERHALLKQRETELLRQRARALSEAVDRMNRSRLALLRETSADLRTSLLGFGPEGVGQMKREVDQLVLSASYHLLMLPHDLRLLVQHAKGSSISIVFALLQLAVALMVFRFWRTNGDAFFIRLEERAREAVIQTGFTRAAAAFAWYGRRVRRPVEWFLFLGVLFQLIGHVEELPEIEFLWLAAMWITIGWGVVLFLDALAERRNLLYRYGYESPELRMRTLRTVALMVVIAGLVLAWTDQGVGRGTVYAWVKTICLLLSVPVLITLLHWWQDPVQERLEDAREEGAVVRWALQHNEGVRRYPATLVGAVFLASRGLWRLSMRQAARFEWMQRVMAYLFRTQVERQAQAQAVDTRKRPLLPSEAPSLRPGATAPGWVEEAGLSALDLIESVAKKGSTLTILVGERGLGRSTTLKRLEERFGEASVLTVGCSLGGVPAFERELTERAKARVGKRDARSSAEALQGSNVRLVCVDDVQRLVRPAVGGLDAFELLVDLAQQHDASIAWVFSITSSAWAVVSRARETALGFDAVVQLPNWSEKQIATLLEMRNEAEGIKPSFKDLTVPRQLDVAEHMDPVERTKIAYYRILWDFSHGNPTVALHFWRQSLFRAESSDLVVVGLFDPPPVREIETLPASMHFMLRAVLQLDLASSPAVAECTGLPVEIVHDALELALRRGYVERVGSELALTLDWFRTISTVLRRQHLLLS